MQWHVHDARWQHEAVRVAEPYPRRQPVAHVPPLPVSGLEIAATMQAWPARRVSSCRPTCGLAPFSAQAFGPSIGHRLLKSTASKPQARHPPCRHLAAGSSSRRHSVRPAAAAAAAAAVTASPAKRVVITGGSRGLGFAMAQQFLAAGDSVAITGRDAERLAAAVEALQVGACMCSPASLPCWPCLPNLQRQTVDVAAMHLPASRRSAGRLPACTACLPTAAARRTWSGLVGGSGSAWAAWTSGSTMQARGRP